MPTRTSVHREHQGGRLRATLLVRDGSRDAPRKELVSVGDPLPAVRLAGQDGLTELATYSAGWLLVWCFPGDDPLPWSIDEVTARSFDERRPELEALNCALVGVSSQRKATLALLASRAKTTYPLLSDPQLDLARQMRLPTLQRDGQELYRPLVFIAREGEVAQVFYRVRPLACAAQAAGWLLGQIHTGGNS
jgi:peroxiredoxin